MGKREEMIEEIINECFVTEEDKITIYDFPTRDALQKKKPNIFNIINKYIPEGAVVLTKEDLEAHDKEVLKKTAEEFATNFENYLCDVDNDYCTDDTVPEALFTSAEIDKVMDRTLKDFGVEVE